WMVRAGLLKLYGYQHPDGGWRWWEYDDSDPWMTAYVVFGLLEARSAGFAVTDTVLNSGVSALKTMAGKPKLDPDTHAYAAYVLALAGETKTAAGLIQESGEAPGSGVRDQGSGSDGTGVLSDWGRAMLALAMSHTDRVAEGKALLEPV